jgi:hypothetical protein
MILPVENILLYSDSVILPVENISSLLHIRMAPFGAEESASPDEAWNSQRKVTKAPDPVQGTAPSLEGLSPACGALASSLG